MKIKIGNSIRYGMLTFPWPENNRVKRSMATIQYTMPLFYVDHVNEL